jgi:hypothetical protein
VGTHRISAHLIAVAVLLTSCGGGDAGDDGVLSLEQDDGPTSTAARIAGDEALLEVTQCMRDRGVDVPDIGITAQGELDLSDEALAAVDLESEEFGAAFAECIAAFGASGGFDVEIDPELEAQYQDQLNSFSQCMRDNGITDFPDPRLGADMPYPLAAWVDFSTDPAFQDAVAACDEVFSVAGLLE